MRRRSISYLINADVFQWKYSSDTGHRWISNPHNIHKLYISSISSSSRTAPSARSNFSSSSRVKGSARSNSIISSFEQGRPVRCSTRTRLDSTRKPSLSRHIAGRLVQLRLEFNFVSLCTISSKASCCQCISDNTNVKF